MKIKDVAKECKISEKTIRYYESMGLLKIDRSANGYRDFQEEQIIRLKEIALLRSLFISIEDIKQYIESKITLDQFLAQQLIALQKDINERQEAKTLMIQMQKKCNQPSFSLIEEYDKRLNEKGMRSSYQDLELQYLSFSNKQKRLILIGILWALFFSFVFNSGTMFEAWLLYPVIGLTVVSLLIWLFTPQWTWLLKVIDIIGRLPNYNLYDTLDNKLQRKIRNSALRYSMILLIMTGILLGVVGVFYFIIILLSR